jgi:hypothetical protein
LENNINRELEDNLLRQLIKQKILNMRRTKGVTYRFIAESAGEPVTAFDLAHLVKDNRKLGRDKLDKLKNFLLIN